MARHKLHGAGSVAPDADVARQLLDQIRSLQALPIPDLKAKWQELLGGAPPQHAKRSFLTQVVAWELQAKAVGGIKPALHRQLLVMGSGGSSVDRAANATPAQPALRPGVKLIRVWQGVTHHVIVTDAGFFWQDRTWRSLSMIAREIAGTAWSGPVFFGLKKSAGKSVVGRPRAGALKPLPAIDASAGAEAAHG